jgi:polyferredoxin
LAIKESFMTAKHWRLLRQISQYLSLALFLGLFVATVRDAALLLPHDLYFRLDPLVAIATLLASRTLRLELALAALTLLLALLAGRAWCGWLCPLGTVLDLVSPGQQRQAKPKTTKVVTTDGQRSDDFSRSQPDNRPKTTKVVTTDGQRSDDFSRSQPDNRPKTTKVVTTDGWRRVKHWLLSATLGAALLGNLTLLVADPLTILFRTLAVAVQPPLNLAVTNAEKVLYPLGPLQRPLEWLENSLRGNLLPTQQGFFQLNLLLALVFVGIVAVNWLAPRFWCRYLCPLGALLAWPTRLAWLRPRAKETCTKCGLCAPVCPTGAIEVSKEAGFRVDASECVMCLDCQVKCPQKAIVMRGDWRLSPAQPYDPTRRQFLASLGSALAGVALLRTAPAAKSDSPWLIRPPGARENNLLDKCIRCGECMKVCPTSGLQPAFLEGGWEGFWTPILVSRLGYCDYSCHACGQVCPTGAIPKLSLEEKRQKFIGTAFIDRNRCIPWVDDRNCIVCEEMCPLPQKAIILEDTEVVNSQGERVLVRRPKVLRELCIGCGICEYQCPLNGPAAIRVGTFYGVTSEDYARIGNK